jgi:hypothetical protein
MDGLMRDPIGDLQAESAAWEDAANDWKKQTNDLQRRLAKFTPFHDADHNEIQIDDILEWGETKTLIKVIYENGCHKATQINGEPLSGIKPDQYTFFPIWTHCKLLLPSED